MSNWVSITSADFADGGWFHQPAMSDVHPALRNAEPTSPDVPLPTDTKDESSNASDSGSHNEPYTPNPIEGFSSLQIEGGSDKVAVPVDYTGNGLIPLYEVPDCKPAPLSTSTLGYRPKSPPRPRFSLFPNPPSDVKHQPPIAVPQRTSSDKSQRSNQTFSSTSLTQSLTSSRDSCGRPDSYGGAWNIQPDNADAISQAHQSSSPPTPAHSFLPNRYLPHSNSFSGMPNRYSVSQTSSASGEGEAHMPKPQNGRAKSMPASTLRKFLKTSTPLVQAAKLGDYNEVLRLLAPGAQTHPISAPDKDGFTPLHHAARLGYAEIAYALIMRHADLEARSKAQDRTPLWFAVHAGHANIVAMLLDNHATVNAPSKMDGATALHKASQQGNLEIMQLLIMGGADVNRRDVEGMPPLMWATQSKKLEAARLLISQGANIEAKIKLGANLELASRDGMTVLQKAVNISDHPSARLYLEMGANANAVGPNGLKPIHKAASKGDVVMCSMLVDAGADIDARTEDGWAPLHFAARYGHEDVAAYLIEADCAPVATTNKGQTAKDIASKYGFAGLI